MADNIEKNANKFSQSRPENGREFEQMQNAQNQLLQIQAGRQQNLLEQRMADSSIADQNALMRQAAELSAMGGNMQVNQATQAAMGRYGLRPQTTSSSKQIRTSQGIVINNNTTNITTVPANIGGPLQGRPLQFQAGSSAGENSKFKDWINKAFDKQNEQAKKRDREYSRRETSLTKSSNKIMRKLEEFSRDITKKLDPRNIGRTVGGQIGTIFRLFGMGYLAANTGKILDNIKNFIDGGKELFSWIKGDKKETPEFIKNITDSFSESFGRVLYGDQVDNDGIKKHGILWGLWNSEGKGVINQFFDSLMDKFKERSELAKSIIKPPKLEKDNIPQNLEAILSSLTSYISILFGGEKAIGRNFESELKTSGDDLRDGKELKKQANAVHGASSRVGYMSKAEMGTGSATAMQNGWKQLENGDFIKEGATPWSRGASSYISGTGQEKAKYLLSNHTDRHGRLTGTDVSQVAAVSDLANALANKNKPGAGMQIFNDLRALHQFSETNDLPIVADPKDVASILGVSESEIRTTPYLIAVRDKLVSERYPGAEVTANMVASRAINGAVAGGILHTAGTMGTIAGTVAGVVALIPGVNVGVAIAGLGCWIAGTILKKVPAVKIAVGSAVLSGANLAKKANSRELLEGVVRMDPFSMKQYWTIYGDYRLPLTKRGYEDLQKGNSSVLRRMGLVIDELAGDGAKLKYRLVRVMPRYENFEKILESAYIEDDIFIVNFKDNLRSLFDDRYLRNVIEAAKQGYIECNNMASINDEMMQTINEKISGQDGFTPVLDSGNAENVAALAKNIGEKGGKELSDLATRMSIASGETSWTDSISNLEAAEPKQTGEKKGMKTTKGIIKDELEANNGNVSWANNGSSSEFVNETEGDIGDFNIQNAIDFIAGHASTSGSTGWCARNVRAALEAGGLDTTGRPGYGGAYGPWLEQHGWEKVTDGSILPGDVEVIAPTGNHRYGHIQMWGGDTYYSDFKQAKEGQVYGPNTKRVRYRYKRSNGKSVAGPRIKAGSLGTNVSSSPYPGGRDINHDSLEGASFWDVVKNGISDVWNKSKVKVVETADGKLMEMVGTQEWINGAVGRGTPVDVNSRPYSGFTRDILRKYSGADYTGGGLSYLNQFGISGTNRASRRVLSSLFDENGKLRVNTSALDPELATRLKNIEAELKKGNEIDIAQVNITAAGIDTTINASRAQSVATNQAFAAYTKNNNKQAPSMTDSEAN